jgi:hypothetical protein
MITLLGHVESEFRRARINVVTHNAVFKLILFGSVSQELDSIKDVGEAKRHVTFIALYTSV